MKKKLTAIIASCVSAVVVMVTLVVCAIVFKPNNETPPNVTTPVVGEEIGGIYFATTAENTGAVDAPSDMKGGAIYLEPGSKFVMTNGSIEDHEGYFGGAVYISNGASFTLEGGNISYNYSMYGGAIYVEKGGVLRINGGSITNNQAQVAPAIYMEAGAELYLDGESSNIKTNEYTEFSPVTVNYYVDGVINKSVMQSVCILNMSNAPLDYYNCPGYYLDEACTKEVARGEQISLNNGGSGALTTLNLYTKRATLDKLKFSILTDINNEDYCSVSAVNSYITGSVVIPKMYDDMIVTFIGSNAFKYCDITSCFMPATIDGIGQNAFGYTEKLTSIDLPKAIIDIYPSAFQYSGITSIHIPESVEYIGSYAFYGSSINSASSDINARIKSCGTQIFGDCTSLTNISNLYIFVDGDIPDFTFASCTSLLEVSVSSETIGREAFAFCTSLDSVVIGEQVRYIDYNAFFGCTGISELYYNPEFATCPTPVPYEMIDNGDVRGNGVFAGLGYDSDVTLHIGSGASYIADNLFYVIDENTAYGSDPYFVRIAFLDVDRGGDEKPLFFGDNCFRNAEIVWDNNYNYDILNGLFYNHIIQGFGKGALQDSIGFYFNDIPGSAFYQLENTMDYFDEAILMNTYPENFYDIINFAGYIDVGDFLAYGGYEFAYISEDIDASLLSIIMKVNRYK